MALNSRSKNYFTWLLFSATVINMKTYKLSSSITTPSPSLFSITALYSLDKFQKHFLNEVINFWIYNRVDDAVDRENKYGRKRMNNNRNLVTGITETSDDDDWSPTESVGYNNVNDTFFHVIVVFLTCWSLTWVFATLRSFFDDQNVAAANENQRTKVVEQDCKRQRKGWIDFWIEVWETYWVWTVVPKVTLNI